MGLIGVTLRHHPHTTWADGSKEQNHGKGWIFSIY